MRIMTALYQSPAVLQAMVTGIITRLLMPQRRLNGLKPYGSDPASGVPPAPDGPTPEGWGVAEATWLAAGSIGHALHRGDVPPCQACTRDHIPYAAMSETSSNRWNLSVISDFSFSA